MKIADILAQSVERASQRLHLLGLLALLNGLITSIVFGPAYLVMNQIMTATGLDENGETSQAIEILSNGLSTLVWGHLAVTAINALLLVPWARAVAQAGLVPAGGSSGQLLLRSTRAFWHLILASIITGGVLILGGFVLFSLASTVGFLAMVLVLAGSFAMVWIAVLVNTSANFSVLLEAQDQPTSLQRSWQLLKPQAGPAAASLACFWVISMMATLLVDGIIGNVGVQFYRLSIVASGTIGFAATAFHISALACLRVEPRL